MVLRERWLWKSSGERSETEIVADSATEWNEKALRSLKWFKRGHAQRKKKSVIVFFSQYNVTFVLQIYIRLYEKFTNFCAVYDWGYFDRFGGVV